jgi:hypothetical protein
LSEPSKPTQKQQEQEVMTLWFRIKNQAITIIKNPSEQAKVSKYGTNHP